MHLLRLRIERLRALEHFDVALSDTDGAPRRRVVFLGANGAGKTTILDAVAHVFDELWKYSSIDRGTKRLDAGDVRRRSRSLKDALSEFEVAGWVGVECALRPAEHRRVKELYRTAPARGRLAIRVGRHADGGFHQRPAAFGDDVDEDWARAFVESGGAGDAGAQEEGQLSQPGPDAGATGRREIPADLVELWGEPPLRMGRHGVAFEDIIRQGFASSCAPCVLLPAKRGALEADPALPLRAVSEFQPVEHCLSRSPERFASLAARLALATLEGSRTPLGKRSQRLWKVLARYFPELPRLVEVSMLQLLFETADRAAVPLSALSDGERAILLLCGEIALRAPEDGVILIDEVEQHLHPRWQRAALEAIPALVPTAQVIITTQSPYVAACAPDDVVEVGDWKRHGE